MRKIYILLIFILLGLTTYAQESPQQFFSKLFGTLKARNADDFADNFVSTDQFRLLAMAYMRAENVTQDSLDKANREFYPSYRSKIKTDFSMILKKADSLHIDLLNSQYVDCKFNEVKDTGTLCTSLSGILYFKAGDRFYQMKVDEAVLIKDEWRIISMGELNVFTDAKRLSEQPDKVSAFGTFSKSNVHTETKLKVVSVVLQPPPPIFKQTPPPKPKKKSDGKQK